MPGLTVDRYGSLLSVQIASQGMELVKDTVYRALWDGLTEMGEPITGTYERNDLSLRTNTNGTMILSFLAILNFISFR